MHRIAKDRMFSLPGDASAQIDFAFHTLFGKYVGGVGLS